MPSPSQTSALPGAPLATAPGWLGRWLRVLSILVLVAALLMYAALTWRWTIIQDSAVMHYVIFLTRHGLRPYRDITDNNLPGAYLLERAAMAVFGWGDLGWRLYDFALSAALVAAFVVIAWPRDWLAGLLAGSLFALRHGREGPWFAAEREQEMTVLVALACMLLFLAVRRREPWLALGFGLLTGLAASIKPTLSFFPLLVLLSLPWALQTRRLRPCLAYLAWAIGGLGIALAVNLAFLEHYSAFGLFLRVTRMVTPVYAGLGDPSRRYLVLHAMPIMLPPLLVLAFAAWWRERQLDWERTVLLLASLAGLLSYFLQRKGFLHHRYLFVAFALLLCGMELMPLTRGVSRLRWLGYAALLFCIGFVVPHELRAMEDLPEGLPMQVAMQADIAALGGPHLQGQVQCFDMILGCLNALYHLQLQENTGFTGDMLLFSQRPNPATPYYQQLYRQAQQRHPADVLVVTNEDFGRDNSFDRLHNWPWFEETLAKNYTLAVQRIFPREGKLRSEPAATRQNALAYRIYLRKGADLPVFHPAPVPGEAP